MKHALKGIIIMLAVLFAVPLILLSFLSMLYHFDLNKMNTCWFDKFIKDNL